DRGEHGAELLDVGPRQRPVDVDAGDDQRTDTHDLPELRSERHQVEPGFRLPAVNRDVACPCVEPDRDLARMHGRELLDDLRLLHGCAAHHHAVRAHGEPGTRVFHRANATTGLYARVDVRADRLDDTEVRVAAITRGVEIHDMDPSRALRREVARDGN